MNTRKRTRFLASGLAASCWLVVGCHSAAPEPALTLPPATSTGANTLGFLLDGRTWTNYGAICVSAGLGSGPCQDNTLLVLSRSHHGVRSLRVVATLATDEHNESFELAVDSVRGPGVYTSGPLAANGVFIPNKLALSDGQTTDPAKRYYQSSSPGAARIVLTHVDTVRHVIAGTFEGRLDLSATAGSIAITQGRFDVAYIP